MKKYLGILLLVLILPCIVPAQTTPELNNSYYRILTDDGSVDKEDLTREMELRFARYNQLFRFDLALLTSRLTVRVFTDKNTYDSYVSARMGSVQNGAIYIHYPDRERRELVIHQGSPEAEQMVPFQAFTQFFRAFIANPPAWMQDGLAVYFNTLRYDTEEKKLLYKENTVWLDTVKNFKGSPSLESILLADVQDKPANFQPVAWSLVSYFLNNGREEHYRTLTDCFMVLSPTATAAQNAERVLRRITSWKDLASLQRDYNAYMGARKSFETLLAEGQEAYTAKKMLDAELSFLSAMDQRPDHYVPYYYLGMMAYDAKDFELAERYYRSALQYGADTAQVNYAMGLNAMSAGRNSDAVTFLKQAAEANPSRYWDRVQDLLKQLG